MSNDTPSTKINLAYSFVEKISRVLFSFIGVGVVARYLGPGYYGELNYLLAICTFLQVFAAFGLEQILIKELLLEKEKVTTVLNGALNLKIVLSAFGLFVYLFFCIILNKTDLIYLSFGFVILSPVFDNARMYLESINQHKVVAKVELKYLILSLCLKLLVSHFRLGVELIFILFVLDFIVPKVILTYKVNTKIRYPVLSLSNDWVRYIKLGWYHFLGAISVFLYMKIDQLMIGQMMSMHELGNYSSAVRLSESWFFIPITISSILYPLALGQIVSNTNRYLQLIFDLNLIISLCIVLGSLFLAKPFYAILFGGSFDYDPLLMLYLFLSGLFVATGLSSGTWLMIKNYNQTIFIRTVTGAFMNIGLNFLLIPVMGIKGCALATLISYASVTFGLVFVNDSSEVFAYLWRSCNIFKSFVRIKEEFLS